MVFPELRALPAHDRLRQHGLWPEASAHARGEIKERVDNAAAILGLEFPARPKAQGGSPGGATPTCPAVGRAIVRKPDCFPLRRAPSPRTLTPKCGCKMRTEISRLHARLDATMIYVTHDQVEAMTMGNRILCAD